MGIKEKSLATVAPQAQLTEETYSRVVEDVQRHRHSVVKRRSFLKGLGIAGATVFLFAIAVMSSSTVAFGQAGQLDSTFGTGGIFTTNFTQTDVTIDNAVAIQSDGKILL